MKKHSQSCIQILIAAFVSCFLLACDAPMLEPNQPSNTVIEDNKDPQQIARQLQRGMEKSQIEQWLGKADYIDEKGLHYYQLDANSAHKLVLDYRNKAGQMTDRLQMHWIDRGL